MAADRRGREGHQAVKVLGLDCSSTSTGAVLLGDDTDYATAWQPDPNKKLKMDVTDRAIWIASKLAELLADEKPDIVVIEEYGFASQSLAPQAEVKGVLLMVLRQMGFSWVLVSPNALKKFVGAKQKEDVKLNVFKRWGFEHKSNDAVDAYVLARIGLCLAGLRSAETVPQKEVLAVLTKSGKGLASNCTTS